MNSPSPVSVSFIVLALNEEIYIEATVQSLLKAIEVSRLSDYQVILVDDGSTDKTGEIVDRLVSQHPKFKAVHNPHNLGIGGAYKQGVRLATCDYIMHLAGDDIMPASDIAAIIENFGKADLLFPYLANPKLRSLGRRIGSKGFTIVINLIFGLKIRYYQGCYPRRDLLEQITITTDSNAFPAEIGVKLLKAGCTYHELAITNTPCKTGHSVALQPKRLRAVGEGIINLVREVRRPGAIPSTLKAKSVTPLKEHA